MSQQPLEVGERQSIVARWDDDARLEITEAPYESFIDLALFGTPGIEVDGDMIILGIPPSCVYRVTGWDSFTNRLEVECWQWFPPENLG